MITQSWSVKLLITINDFCLIESLIIMIRLIIDQWSVNPKDINPNCAITAQVNQEEKWKQGREDC